MEEQLREGQLRGEDRSSADAGVGRRSRWSSAGVGVRRGEGDRRREDRILGDHLWGHWWGDLRGKWRRGGGGVGFRRGGGGGELSRREDRGGAGHRGLKGEVLGWQLERLGEGGE